MDLILRILKHPIDITSTLNGKDPSAFSKRKYLETKIPLLRFGNHIFFPKYFVTIIQTKYIP
jgi:hypothetical protein